MINQTLTAIEGLQVGHAQNLDGPTGCNVVLCPPIQSAALTNTAAHPAPTKPIYYNLCTLAVTPPSMASNTVIGVVATNAQLSKEQANKVEQMAQDGISCAVRPAHTLLDENTIFALVTGGTGPANVN